MIGWILKSAKRPEHSAPVVFSWPHEGGGSEPDRETKMNGNNFARPGP
jgi:hypothetical protein